MVEQQEGEEREERRRKSMSSAVSTILRKVREEQSTILDGETILARRLTPARRGKTQSVRK